VALNLNHKVQGGSSKFTAGFPLQYPGEARWACTIVTYLISLFNNLSAQGTKASRKHNRQLLL